MTDEMMRRACANILSYGLKASQEDRLLLLFDSEKERIAQAFVQEASRIGLTSRCMRFPSAQGERQLLSSLEAELERASSSGPVVVLMSHTMLQSLGFQAWGSLIGFPSKPHPRVFSDWVLPLDSFPRIYGVDWSHTAAYRDELLGRLNRARSVLVQSVTGTRIELTPRRWIGGPLNGIFGNMTEVYTAPVEESVGGVIVYDASMYYGRPPTPVRVHVEEGRIVEVDGRESERQLEWFVADSRRDAGASIIAEFGIGLNAGANAFGDVMEAECARGTCHFDFGDNVGFGGRNRSKAHFGGVCSGITILDDGRRILVEGLLPP